MSLLISNRNVGGNGFVKFDDGADFLAVVGEFDLVYSFSFFAFHPRTGRDDPEVRTVLVETVQTSVQRRVGDLNNTALG